MPTQMEVEYWRNRYQRMNKERFVAANGLALATHTLTQPLDMVKTRAQMLQEGKTFTGIGFQKGLHGTNLFNELYNTGGGLRQFYSKFDAFFMRTVGYTTARIWAFLYFYDWLNPDSRRQARPDFYGYAGFLGGMAGGILSNPFEIVFTRMQADGMYPESQRRNYKGFVDGIVKVSEEGALFRGGMANGLKLGGMVFLASGILDWMKENTYYFFGPMALTRFVAVTSGVATAFVFSMPFDAIRTRLHTMRPLPNGEMPYSGTMDCFSKMLKYEMRWDKQSNYGAFFTGGQAYFARLWLISMFSVYFLDYYTSRAKATEFWQPARYQYTTGIDYDIHDPYTEGFYKQMTTNWMAKGAHGGAHPDGKSQIKLM